MRSIAIVLAVGVCTAGMPQGPKTTARRSAPVELALQIADYATLPITGSPTGAGKSGSLARVGVMREEPGVRRFFVGDLNGPLYILDKRTRASPPTWTSTVAARRPASSSGCRPRPGIRRLHQFRLRSRVRAQRHLLHDPHGRTGRAWRPASGQREVPRLERHRLHGDCTSRRRRARSSGKWC